MYTEVIYFLNYIFKFWIILTILNNNQLSNKNQLKFHFYFLIYLYILFLKGINDIDHSNFQRESFIAKIYFANNNIDCTTSSYPNQNVYCLVQNQNI